jgi:solute carrier family 25 (mitochondrial phosphate transporter), member 23/24/25/41
MFHALGTVYREEGFRALYKGWLPSVIGVVGSFVTINLFCYDLADEYLSLYDWLSS